MKNPNAVAALVSSQAVLGLEQIAARYLSAKLGSVAEQEIVSAATVAVLYIGRDGLRAALGKAFGAVKALWTGPAAPPVA